MHVTDPVEVGSTGIELTDKNIVPFVSNQAYALFDTAAERKLVLGRVAQAVLGGFLEQQGEDASQAACVAAGLRRRTRAGLERRSARCSGRSRLTTVGGAFHPSGTDAISVVTNSASGTKLDFYQKRTVSYDVQLGGGGTATAALTVDLQNDSPTSGFPPYVIGPYRHFSTQPGENVAVVDLYCDIGCALREATRNGEPVELSHDRIGGYPFFEDYVRTPSGDTATITANLVLTQAWERRRDRRHLPIELRRSDHDHPDPAAREHHPAGRDAVHVDRCASDA